MDIWPPCFFLNQVSDLEIWFAKPMFNHVQLWRSWNDHLSCHWKLKNQTIALPVQRIYLKPCLQKQSANLKGSFSRSPASVWSLWLFSHTNGQRYSSFLLCLVSQSFCSDLPASFSKDEINPIQPPEGARGLRSLSSGWERGKLHLSLPRNFWVCRSGNWSVEIFVLAFLARKLSFNELHN